MQVIIQSHLTNKLHWMQESGTRWYYLSVHRMQYDGEGYVSANGFEWENVKNVENCNICIKAFSNDR